MWVCPTLGKLLPLEVVCSTLKKKQGNHLVILSQHLMTYLGGTRPLKYSYIYLFLSLCRSPFPLFPLPSFSPSIPSSLFLPFSLCLKTSFLTYFSLDEFFADTAGCLTIVFLLLSECALEFHVLKTQCLDLGTISEGGLLPVAQLAAVWTVWLQMLFSYLPVFPYSKIIFSICQCVTVHIHSW